MSVFPKTVRAGNVPYMMELRSGAELLDDEVGKVARLICECGAVSGTTLQIQHRLRKAYLVIIALWADEIAGVAALKSPAFAYRNTLQEKVGVELSASDYSAELGYVAVSEAHRGNRLSSRLMSELMSLPAGADGVFATTKRDGYRMEALPNLGFTYRGFYRNDGGETVHLLTKSGS